MIERFRVQPGRAVELAEIDTKSTDGAPGGKAETSKTFPGLYDELRSWHDRLWAEGRRSVLLVLQAMDAAGKDGTIRHLFRGLQPQAARVTSFKVPTEEERSHDFLWRVHKAAPAAGEIGVFNRSHYEDVITVRVEKLASESVWRPRYRLINDFEELLAHGGTTVVKIYLHISKEEQRRRLEDRLHESRKRWRFKPEDLEKRDFWDEYMEAFEEVFQQTSTERAPWYIIPVDHKWYRNWAVSQVVISTLRHLNPEYPEPPGLDGLDIE
jgi:PPK2 family polyphosphate:nucleotide phosphotransferase